MKNNWLNCLIVIIYIVEKSSGTKPKPFGINFENTILQPVRGFASSYKNHPSITKIKQVVNGSDVSDSERFSFKTVNKTEIKNLFKNLDIKKASGTDTILFSWFFDSITHESHQHVYYTKCVSRKH